MSNPIIRKADINDLKEVQNLNLSLFKSHIEYDKQLDLNWPFSNEGTEYFSERISSEDGCVLVAEIQDEIVGYLCGGIREPETYRKIDKAAELENMFINPNHRSKKVGSKLISEFLNWCKSQKVQKVKVEASAQNHLAINFYKKNNFNDYSLSLELDLKQGG